MDNRRPSLVVIAGPNGAGKSTFIEELRLRGALGGFRYINADEIARDEFGDWNSPEATLRAARRADELREACLANAEDFAFETVFSTDQRVQLLARAARAGYFIDLFFIGTADPAINARRVAQRVREQGHDVPLDRIVPRHGRSLANLPAGLRVASRGYVYDNSVDGAEARLVLRTREVRCSRLSLQPFLNGRNKR